MTRNSGRLSRREFVGNSAVAFGMLGAAGLASGQRELQGAEGRTNEMRAGILSTVNAHEFGARGDGKTDDSKGLQAALEAAATKGPICHIPAGLYRLDGPLVVPPGGPLVNTSGTPGRARWS